MSILFTLKSDWIDGSTEFKCNRRHSASFPDTTEITSSTYRFQKKGLTGEVAEWMLHMEITVHIKPAFF